MPFELVILLVNFGDLKVLVKKLNLRLKFCLELFIFKFELIDSNLFIFGTVSAQRQVLLESGLGFFFHLGLHCGLADAEVAAMLSFPLN